MKGRDIPPSLPQQNIPPQQGPGPSQPPPRVEVWRGPVQPYTVRNTLSLVAGSVPALPFKVELDLRTRFLVLINEGADPAIVGPATDILWSWGQPSGPNGVLHPGDSFPFEWLYLAMPVIWFNIPIAAVGSGILVIHGW